jgi:hypothetical protein
VTLGELLPMFVSPSLSVDGDPDRKHQVDCCEDQMSLHVSCSQSRGWHVVSGELCYHEDTFGEAE